MKKINKKGAISDILLSFGPILAIAITIILATYIWTEYSNELGDAVDLSEYPYVQRAMDKTTEGPIPLLDKIFLAFVIATFLGTLILGIRLRTSPIFIAFILIIMPLVVLLAKIMKDTYAEFSGHETLASSAAGLTLTNHLMSNLPIVAVVFTIGLSVALFVVRRAETL